MELGHWELGQKRNRKTESEDRRWEPSGHCHKDNYMKKEVRPCNRIPRKHNLRSKQIGKINHILGLRAKYQAKKPNKESYHDCTLYNRKLCVCAPRRSKTFIE